MHICCYWLPSFFHRFLIGYFNTTIMIWLKQKTTILNDRCITKWSWKNVCIGEKWSQVVCRNENSSQWKSSELLFHLSLHLFWHAGKKHWRQTEGARPHPKHTCIISCLCTQSSVGFTYAHFKFIWLLLFANFAMLLWFYLRVPFLANPWRVFCIQCIELF